MSTWSERGAKRDTRTVYFSKRSRDCVDLILATDAPGATINGVIASALDRWGSDIERRLEAQTTDRSTDGRPQHHHAGHHEHDG